MPEQPEGQPLVLDVTYQVEKYASGEVQVRIVVEGFQVMLILIHPDNFSNSYFNKLQHFPTVLAITNEQRELFLTELRRVEAETGRQFMADEVEALERGLMRRVQLSAIKQSTDKAAKRVADNFKNVADMAWKLVFQSAGFSGANEFRDIINMQDEKYSAKDIWENLKPLAGVQHGGKRQRKAAFSWDAEKALKFYQTVEALPRYGADSRPMWEQAREVLRDNDYDHDTIQFLRSRPAFQDVPEELLKEAANVWRQYDESWNSLPPENSPLAFAFRHACHKLDFPYTAYNTVRTNYYKGKKGAEGTR